MIQFQKRQDLHYLEISWRVTQRFCLLEKLEMCYPGQRSQIILLLAPTATCMCGVLLPKWYPVNMAHQFLGLGKAAFTRYAAHQQPVLTEAMDAITRTMDELTNLGGKSKKKTTKMKRSSSAVRKKRMTTWWCQDLEASSNTREEVDKMDDLELWVIWIKELPKTVTLHEIYIW